MKKSLMFGLIVFAVFVFGFVGAVSADQFSNLTCSQQGGQICNLYESEFCNGTVVEFSNLPDNQICCQQSCVKFALSKLVLTKLEKTQNNSAIYFCVKNVGNESSPGFYLDVTVNNSLSPMGGPLDFAFGFREMPLFWSNPLAPNQEECNTQYLNAQDALSGFSSIDSALIDSFKSKNEPVTLVFKIQGVQAIPNGRESISLNQTPSNNTLTYSWSDIRNEISDADFKGTLYYGKSETNQINQNLSQFLIFGNIGRWSFDNGSGQVTHILASPKGLSREYTIYENTYTSGEEDAKVEVAQFSSGVVNEDFLKDFIRIAIGHRFVNIKSKTFDNKTYLYAESTEKETTLGNSFSGESGTTKTYTISNYNWYSGDKIVAISSRKDYANDTEQLLTAYLNKYPSELTAPQGFIEKIVNFFRNLFG